MLCPVLKTRSKIRKKNHIRQLPTEALIHGLHVWLLSALKFAPDFAWRATERCIKMTYRIAYVCAQLLQPVNLGRMWPSPTASSFPVVMNLKSHLFSHHPSPALGRESLLLQNTIASNLCGRLLDQVVTCKATTVWKLCAVANKLRKMNKRRDIMVQHLTKTSTYWQPISFLEGRVLTRSRWLFHSTHQTT